MKLVFLGTGGMVPTKQRNVMSMYLEYGGQGILIDCGEGTQRQMSLANINRLKIKKILITHWHGDHVAGLIGLIQTLGNVDNPSRIDLYGPKQTKHYMSHLLKSCSFDLRADLHIHEIEPTKQEPITFFENEHFSLQAANMLHKIECLGYSFIEKNKRNIQLEKVKELGLEQGPLLGKLQKGQSITINNKTISPDDVSTIKQGKKITFILDTTFTPAIRNIAKDADLLISEANYESSLKEKAQEYKHMTAQDVASIAKEAKVKRLILTHFSQRYKSVESIQKEAQEIFPNTACAYDFMKLTL